MIIHRTFADEIKAKIPLIKVLKGRCLISTSKDGMNMVIYTGPDMERFRKLVADSQYANECGKSLFRQRFA